MTTQNSASQFAQAGQKLFFASYEPTDFIVNNPAAFSDIGLQGVAIAPDSDVDLADIAYDLNIAGGSGTVSSEVVISPGAPLLGLMPKPAQAFDPNAPSQANAIVASSPRFFAGQGIFDWFQHASTLGSQSVFLKLMGYIGAPPPSLPRSRSPKHIEGLFTVNGTDVILTRIPFYGRGLFHLLACATTGNAGAITYKTYGVRFQDISSNPVLVDRVLLSTIVAAANTQTEFAFQDKTYDAIEITTTSAGSYAGSIYAECADLAIF